MLLSYHIVLHNDDADNNGAVPHDPQNIVKCERGEQVHVDPNACALQWPMGKYIYEFVCTLHFACNIQCSVQKH